MFKDSTDLMLLDNHESNISIHSLNLAKDDRILMIHFHISVAKLKTLNRSIYGILEKYFIVALESYMLNHPGKLFMKKENK